jgi:hypothetical protein
MPMIERVILPEWEIVNKHQTVFLEFCSLFFGPQL